MQLTFRQKIPPPLCGSSTKGSHRSSIVGFSALCGRWRYALRGILAYGLLCAFTLWCVGSLSGTWRTMFVAFLGLVHKVYACGMLAGTVIATTRVNEFLSAMTRGIENPKPRTCLVTIRMTAADWAVMALFAAFFAIELLWTGGIL